jgi:tetratricopeptide (TPR) repeat protein
MTCPRCGTEIPVGAGFCATCGAPQARPAPAADATGVGAREFTAFETISPVLHAPGHRTEQIDADVTRLGDVAATSGAFATSTSPDGGAARKMQMLVAGQTLGTRYHVIRLLGVGGMGAVYHAWDAELGVAVALKVIRSDVSGDSEAAAAIERQFKRELLLARQVTHKHVVRIHDLAEIDGVKYITMPYVQGADLASVLRQTGKLPIPRALKYVAQIVDGLVAAHEAGVVHRDLKPANIMIDEGDQALIMDFGIARAASNTGSGVTKVVGTLAYMAPEQAQAQATDQRADVYSLGMMLREMLVGRTSPADGEQAVADLMQRINHAPLNLRSIDASIPEPLDAMVQRCVQPKPASRFRTSRELAAAITALDENGHLRPEMKAQAAPASSWRLGVAAAVVVMAIGAAAVFVRRPPPAAPKAIDPVSILVADFENKTGDAVFDGALEQPLTIAMEGASFVTTYARSNALKLAQTLSNATKLDATAARPVAFREGVKYVLAGSIARSGGAFRLQVDAVEPATGKAARSATATAGTKGEVLAAIGSIASKIRTGLGDTTSESAKLAANETFTAGSIDAMREYSTAQDLQNGGRNDEALAHYQKAIAVDPKFGRAYAGAANISFRLGRQAEGEAQFAQALSLMDRMTEREKHRTLGSYYLNVTRNYEKAVEEYTALVRAYPVDGGGHANLAYAYFGVGDYARSMEEGRRAIETDPSNLIAKYNQALYAMYAGDFDDAANLGKVVAAANASQVKAFLPMAVAAVMKGDDAGAAAAYDAMRKAGPAGGSLAAIGTADLALYAGRAGEVAQELKPSIDADLANKSTAPAAAKQIIAAEAELATGRAAKAVDAAHEALKLSIQPAAVVPAARILTRAGRTAEARTLAAELGRQLPKQSRAYGKIVLAEIALEEKKPAEAADLLTQARAITDLWLGRFDLGVAYVEANAFAEAISELEACQKRRGEATALFFDDRPTVRYLATLPYWLGRAQEGLGQRTTAKTSYAAFVTRRPDVNTDPLVQDARRRISAP